MQKISNSQHESYHESEKSPLVSIVVTTKNEEKNIDMCLKSVKQQSFSDVELIVVDNFSEDQTAEVAKRNNAKVYFKGNERSTQRNFGAKVATGKYVLYLDADMILSPLLIEECVRLIGSTNSDALYIPEKIIGDGFWIKVRDFERSFYTGTLIDAVRFIKRDLFLQVGGFDETLVGPEDWDFDRKIRTVGRTATINSPLYHNEGKFKINRYLKKKGYYTNGIKAYKKKWGSTDKETIKQVGVQYRLLGVFVEKGKWKRLINHPVLTIAMYFLRLRVALVYLRS